MFRFARLLAALGLVFASQGVADAAPITVSGDAVSLTKLGDTIGSDFDKINVHAFGPTAFNIPSNTPTTVALSAFDFVVGINATAAHAGYHYTLNVPFTIDGVSGVLSQPFTLDINTSDTLTFQTGAPTSFALPGGGTATVTLLGQNFGTQPVGTHSGTLSAQVVVTPEPATLAVFGGIALIGAVGHRRRKAPAIA